MAGLTNTCSFAAAILFIALPSLRQLRILHDLLELLDYDEKVSHGHKKMTHETLLTINTLVPIFIGRLHNLTNLGI